MTYILYDKLYYVSSTVPYNIVTVYYSVGLGDQYSTVKQSKRTIADFFKSSGKAEVEV